MLALADYPDPVQVGVQRFAGVPYAGQRLDGRGHQALLPISAVRKGGVRDAEEARLKKEAELDKTPIDQLPFPSIKYASFMRRLSRMIRQYGINGEKKRLIDLSNLIDKKIA